MQSAGPIHLLRAHYLHRSTAKYRQYGTGHSCPLMAVLRAPLFFTIAGVAKPAKFFAAEAVMKAVLALVMIYVAMFFLAIQGASPSSVQAERQNGASQAARSIDPVKETDIRSRIELVGARHALQDFTDHGADQLRGIILASVPKTDPSPQVVNALLRV